MPQLACAGFGLPISRSPDVRCGPPGLRSLDSDFASPSMAACYIRLLPGLGEPDSLLNWKAVNPELVPAQ